MLGCPAPGEPAAPPPPAPAPESPAGQPAADISPELAAALARLQLPGVKINLDQWSVDVDATVCLREGLLELIACTKDTKEHESIVAIDAKPSHLHTALLLLGAKPGNPAMRQAVDEEATRFIDLPPRGGSVEVFLVLKDPAGKESARPISAFIAPAEHADGPAGPGDGSDPAAGNKFPTHTFLFTGSILHGEGDGPRQYLCDQSGNVISLATFGDELLALPGIHDDANGALVWQVDGDQLPERGAKVTLRLRPQLDRRPTTKPTQPAKPAQ
jgi:hypothetical protein